MSTQDVVFLGNSLTKFSCSDLFHKGLPGMGFGQPGYMYLFYSVKAKIVQTGQVSQERTINSSTCQDN